MLRNILITTVRVNIFMTSIQEAKNIECAIKEVLSEIVEAYRRHRISKTKLPIDDVRSCIFEGLLKSLNNYYLSLMPLRSIETLSLVKANSFYGSEIISREYLTYCKWAYLTNVWVLVEESLKDLMSHLEVSETNKACVLIDRCIDAAGLKKELKDLLTIFRHVRNSMHRNGTHTNKSEAGTYMWNDQCITFEFGKPIEGWVLGEKFLIVELQKGLIELFEGFFECSRLKDKKHIQRVYCPPPYIQS